MGIIYPIIILIVLFIIIGYFRTPKTKEKKKETPEVDQKELKTNLRQIISNIKGKHCDILPFGSIQHKDKIPNSFEFKKLNFKIENSNEKCKFCPDCNNLFTNDIPFISSNQIGDEQETCLRCFEKKYIAGGREKYREALIKELEWIRKNKEV